MAASETHMIAVVQAYIDAFEASDADAAAALFAEDGAVEDPIGSPPVQGSRAIREFYFRAMATNAKLELDLPVRVGADHAAFAFRVRLEWEGKETIIDVIDVFRFNEAGKVAKMTAFFGPSNMRAA